MLLNGFGAKATIDAATTDVGAHGVPVAYSAADVSKPDEIAGTLAQAARELAPMDILANNTGSVHRACRGFPA